MKKVFAIFAIAAVLVACNNEGTGSDTTDSIQRADSIRRADSTAAANAAAAAAPSTDSLNAAADSLKVAADSLKK